MSQERLLVLCPLLLLVDHTVLFLDGGGVLWHGVNSLLGEKSLQATRFNELLDQEILERPGIGCVFCSILELFFLRGRHGVLPIVLVLLAALS